MVTIFERFAKGVKEIKRRAEFKNLVLEKQLQEIQARFDERQQQLREVIFARSPQPKSQGTLITMGCKMWYLACASLSCASFTFGQ